MSALLGCLGSIQDELSKPDLVLHATIESAHLIPAISGVLLEFPVIYYLNGSSDGNCLSQVPLRVYKVLLE